MEKDRDAWRALLEIALTYVSSPAELSSVRLAYDPAHGVGDDPWQGLVMTQGRFPAQDVFRIPLKMLTDPAVHEFQIWNIFTCAACRRVGELKVAHLLEGPTGAMTRVTTCTSCRYVGSREIRKSLHERWPGMGWLPA